ncbi:MAG: hypothetical protein AAB884_00005, partial [Patescibacteria group bacterium]
MIVVAIITGNEERFLKEALDLKKYLRVEVGIEDITLMQGGFLVKHTVPKFLSRIISRLEKEDVLLLAYTRHATQQGWVLSGSEVLPYGKLGEVLLGCDSQILIINDCCHAMQISILREVPSQRVGLIAACASDEDSFGGLVADIINQWRVRQVFTPLEKIYPL